MTSLSVTASIVLLTAGASPQATQSSRPWMEQVKVTLGPPIVVAQAEHTGLIWGIWQFPTMSRPEPGKLLLAFNMNEDRPYDNPADLKPPGRYASTDGGKCWQPCDLDWGFTSLYGPVKLCHRRNGDVLYSSSKSGLMVKHADNGQWHAAPYMVDDAIAGVTNTDQKHPSVSLYPLGQIVELPDRSLLGIRGARLQGMGSGTKPKWGTYCLKSVDDGQRFTHTSGYTSLVARGPNRFLIAYDQFDYPNADGEPRKTILVREVVVK